MRFYFHISNGAVMAEDHEGVELPTFVAALDEGGKIAGELLDDPDTESFHGGVVMIVGSDGLSFMNVPIARPHEIAAGRLN